MIQTIAIAAGILIAGLLGFAATRPDSFQVQRTISIQAPPETVFAFIQDFRQWASWSPYEKLDPAMQKTLSGAPSGKGAVYEWVGNNKAGAGRMEITEASSPSASAPSNVTIKLDFSRPFQAHNTAEFTLVPEGGSTSVTWALSGPQKYKFKVISVFVSMDTMIGKEFETGLASLKGIAEKRPDARAAAGTPDPAVTH